MLGLLGSVAPKEFVSHLTVFVLACFVGWQVVWNVTPALHTPLMSVTNAISGIILVGGMLQISGLIFARHFAQRRRGAACHDQPQRRLLGHHAHAAHVSTVIVMPESLTTIAYLVAGVLFILSLASQLEHAKDRASLECPRHCGVCFLALGATRAPAM